MVYRWDVLLFPKLIKIFVSGALYADTSENVCSLGTATSAVWKTICRDWRMIFAPISISFSRSVVNVQ